MNADNSTPNKTINGTDDIDSIKNSGAVVQIYAQDGADTINNSANLVTISAGAGNDSVKNTGSNVEISLDDGDDYVYNSDGTDVKIYGGAGKDSVYNVSSSKVSIYGGADNDSIDNYGKDIFISGDEGNDYINNISSNVTISGGAGNDTINHRWSSKISICGGAGNDAIYSYGHNVTINGGAGSDKISLTNDSNNDVIQYVYGDGDDTVFGFNSNDTLQITTPKSFETLIGGNDLYFIFDNGSITLKNVTSANVVTIAGGNDTVSVDENTTTTTTVTPETVTTTTTTEEVTTTTSTPTVTSGTGGGDTIINNYYYGDTYNMDGNNGTIVIGSSVEGGVTNNTSVDNSTNIVISGNTWTYSGGNKVINNYQQGEVVQLASDYQGIDVKGNSFYVKSSSGSLEIQNSRDKFISYSGSDNNVVAYSYLASSGGTVDGRDKSQAEIFIGGDHNNNQIYAGNGGSSLWGGNGGADTLTGGNGYDEFFFAIGSGGDVVQNASSNDIVNLLGISLYQISDVYVSTEQVHINFTSGEFLQVKGNTGVGYRLQEKTYVCNQSTGQWSIK